MGRQESVGADAVRDGIASMEGYLLWQGEIEQARMAAEAFADRLDWLTSGQREQVTDLYTRTELDRSRASIAHTAQRARQLRQEYQDRYDHLRRRAVACCLTLGAAAVLLVCLVRAL
ncbi:hypothetical protein AB0A99_22495 [Streptomyces fradiae]|uniref:hypothetical protein n=1 Tax=Streptomyces fradiae TaxID=1906 RepID=UPI0034105419